MKLLILIGLLIGGCVTTPQKHEKNLYESNVVLTDHLKAGRYSNIYFSAQPKQEDWGALKEQGFTHVINLRQSQEHDEKNEKQTLESLGLNYSQVPMDASQPLTPAKVKAVNQAVKAHRSEGKTLIHCGSANRAAYWAGAHFYLDHDYSKEKSITLAKTLGLTNADLEDQLSNFIEEHNKR